MKHALLTVISILVLIGCGMLVMAGYFKMGLLCYFIALSAFVIVMVLCIIAGIISDEDWGEERTEGRKN